MRSRRNSSPQTIHPPQESEQQQSTGAEITSRLAECGYFPLRTIRCEVRNELVILSGIVPTYYLKQVAQTVAFSTAGVKQVENRLEVRSEN